MVSELPTAHSCWVAVTTDSQLRGAILVYCNTESHICTFSVQKYCTVQVELESACLSG